MTEDEILEAARMIRARRELEAQRESLNTRTLDPWPGAVCVGDKLPYYGRHVRFPGGPWFAVPDGMSMGAARRLMGYLRERIGATLGLQETIR